MKGFSVDNKQKVGDLEAEMNAINERLEHREQEITRMKEQFEMQERGEEDVFANLDEESKRMLKEVSGKPIESKVRHLLDEETEQEDNDMLDRVMADLDEFKKMTDKSEEEEAKGGTDKASVMENVKLIEQIMQEQTKYSAMVSEFMLKDAEESKAAAA